MTWLRQYGLLLRWQFLNLKTSIPIVLVVQIFIGVGTVLGYSFLLDDIDETTGKFFATGASTLALITLGLVFLPQGISEMKSRHTFEYLWALPISRFAFVAADFTIWMLVLLPSVIITLLVGSWRYGFDLDITHPLSLIM